MQPLQNPSLSPQASAIYKLLLVGQPLTAAQIGQRLGVFATAVYRSIESLKQAGCVTQSGSYPAVFNAVTPDEAVERFSLVSRDVFLAAFSGAHSTPPDLQVQFIKDRKALLKMYVHDLETVTKDVCLIISGHDLPPDVHAGNINAISQGVTIRMIVQRYDHTNRDQIKAWQACGIDVRYSDAIGVRLVVLDHRIVHLLSYQDQAGLSDLGVKISHSSIAALMAGVFEEKWQKARVI